jgi:putative phage-type endonuclease
VIALAELPTGAGLPGIDQPFEAVCSSSDRERWLDARRSGIGSSDAAAVLGVYPWRTPLQTYADKIGLEEDTEASEAAYWGTKIEPLVLERFAAATGRTVRGAGMLIRSTSRRWQLATLDGVQMQEGRDGPGNVEVKCTGLVERWDDGIPPYVYAQAQHQLAVTGYKWGSVAVLFNGREFFFKDFDRDEEFIAELVRMEATFWRRVTDLEPPDPEGSEADRKVIAKLFPADVDPSPVLLGGEFINLDERLCLLKDQKKEIEAEVGTIENRIRMAIGEHVEALLPSGVKFTHKLQHRKETVQQASSFRVLRRSERKAK